MHYYALVVIPAEGDVDDLVGEALAPYREDLDETEDLTFGLWDWWQVGGRYSGRLSGYEPREDPANSETCWLCQGTGKRADELGREWREQNPDYTCNGCQGSGQKVKWPTQWPPHAFDAVDLKDVTPVEWVSALHDDQLPYTIFAHGSESVALREKWTGKDFIQVLDTNGMRRTLLVILEARRAAGLIGDRVVVVDYHS